jgi:hypothetical protein
MAAASYTTDLLLINECEVITNFTEPTGGTAGGTAAQENEFYVQNSFSISKTFNATGVGGLHYNNGTGITLPTDGAVFTWIYWTAPNSLATKANGGQQITIGSGVGAYRRYYVAGGDTNIYGGWVNYPVNPTVASSLNQGTPTTTYQYFGYTVNNTLSISRGNPYGIDVIRYGRGSIIITDGDLANGYATFPAAATVNDSNTTGAFNRWGIFSEFQTSFKMQGRLQFGSAGTAVDFRDSNRTITIQNTEFVTSLFNMFEIINASSRVDWTNISIQSLSTASRGTILVTDNADFNVQGCVFNDLGTFTFLSNSSIDDTTFRRCEQITTGGASFTNNFVRNSTSSASIAATFSEFSTITGNDFLSDGSNHAISVPSTAGTTNVTWNNTLTGYVAGTAGNNVGTTSGTGNEAIYITGTTTSTVNITVAAGATIPSIRKDSANVTVNITANQLTFTISGIQSGTELRVYTYTDVNDPTTYTEFAGAEIIGASPEGSTFSSVTGSGSTFTATKTYDGGTAIPVLIVAHNLDYQFFRQTTTLSASENTSFTLFQVSDRNYDEGATPYV